MKMKTGEIKTIQLGQPSLFKFPLLNANVPNDGQSASPEHNFLSAALILTIQDALGASPAAKKMCFDCHREVHYKCLNHKCPHRHTVQECANRWLASPEADGLCASLGIDSSYLRKWITNAKTRGYTGLPSQTRRAFKSSSLGGKISGGEAA